MNWMKGPCYHLNTTVFFLCLAVLFILIILIKRANVFLFTQTKLNEDLSLSPFEIFLQFESYGKCSYESCKKFHIFQHTVVCILCYYLDFYFVGNYHIIVMIKFCCSRSWVKYFVVATNMSNSKTYFFIAFLFNV